MSDKSTDVELIEQIKEGNRASFELLIERHKNYAFTLAVRIVQNKEDAEEIAHDAFLKAFKSIGNFKMESKFTTWFYRIVVNLSISKRRKKYIDTEEINDTNMSHYGTFDEVNEMNSADRRFFIEKAMNSLNDEARTLLTLYYFEEMSLEEVEAITGVDKNNLKVKIFRARKKLAQELTILLKDEVHSLL